MRKRQGAPGIRRPPPLPGCPRPAGRGRGGRGGGGRGPRPPPPLPGCPRPSGRRGWRYAVPEPLRPERRRVEELGLRPSRLGTGAGLGLDPVVAPGPGATRSVCGVRRRPRLPESWLLSQSALRVGGHGLEGRLLRLPTADVRWLARRREGYPGRPGEGLATPGAAPVSRRRAVRPGTVVG